MQLSDNSQFTISLFSLWNFQSHCGLKITYRYIIWGWTSSLSGSVNRQINREWHFPLSNMKQKKGSIETHHLLFCSPKPNADLSMQVDLELIMTGPSGLWAAGLPGQQAIGSSLTLGHGPPGLQSTGPPWAVGCGPLSRRPGFSKTPSVEVLSVLITPLEISNSYNYHQISKGQLSDQ